jgi:hypothetical protein
MLGALKTALLANLLNDTRSLVQQQQLALHVRFWRLLYVLCGFAWHGSVAAGSSTHHSVHHSCCFGRMVQLELLVILGCHVGQAAFLVPAHQLDINTQSFQVQDCIVGSWIHLQLQAVNTSWGDFCISQGLSYSTTLSVWVGLAIQWSQTLIMCCTFGAVDCIGLSALELVRAMS